MDPQSQQRRLGIVIILVAPQQALEYLRNIPQIEQIMYLRGRRQHLRNHVLVQIDRGIGNFVSHKLHCLIKFHQMLGEHGVENSSYRRFIGEGHVDDVESAQEPFGNDVPAAAGWSHGRQDQHVLDVFSGLLLSVVPEAVVHPLTQEF